jgi:hypothetical protein
MFSNGSSSSSTGFAAGDHPLRLLQSCGVDKDDVLTFGSGIEEISHSLCRSSINGTAYKQQEQTPIHYGS